MLNHVVLFAFDGFESAEHKASHLAEIKAQLEALPSCISALHDMRVVLNENPAESYDLMLTAVVDSLATLPDYAGHPEHVRVVVDYIKPYLRQRACVDFSE